MKKRLFFTIFFLSFLSFIPSKTVAEEPLKVIILPLSLHSIEDISDVRLKVMEGLAREVDKASEIEVVDGEVLKRIVGVRGKEVFSEEEAFSIGTEEGVEFVVIGSLTKIGKNFSLDIKILNIPRKRLSALAYIEDDDSKELLKRLPSLSIETRKVILKEALTFGKVFVREEEVIGKISVSGNRRIDTEAILAKVTSRVGEPFSMERIKEDLQSIYDMGYFYDILVDLVDTVAGKEITFIVKEKPVVKQVEVSGNKKVGREAIDEVITVKPNTILKRALLKEDVERIKALYIKKGFYLAEVSYRIDSINEDEVVVTFDIEEGVKVKVKRITFIGNTVFNDKELKKAMRTKEAGLLSFVTSRGVFDDLIFDNDINIILGKYFDKGYIQAEVGRPQIDVSEDKRWVFIALNIKEGEQFRVGKVEVEGDIIKTRMELMERLKTKPGNIFSRSLLSTDITTLTDLYADEGYAFVDVKPVTRVDEEKRIVDITLNITQGEKVSVERIDIAGNVKTRDKVIRREIEIGEGELYSATKIKRSKRNLNRLGYFDEVDITSQPGSAPDKMILKVDVKERPTGAFAMGAGYSSVDNMIFSLSISQNNLFGTGRKLNAEATLSSSTQRYDISFTEPWFLDRPISAGFDLFRIDKEYPNFSRFSNGGDIRFGFPVYTDTRLFLTYKLEEVEVKDVAPSASILIREQEGRRKESSVSSVIKRDTRNNLLDPTEGSMQSFSFDFAGGFLGGDNNFLKYVLIGEKYFPMPRDTTLFVKGTAGYISSFGGKSIPIYERFFLGGINTIRGFKTRSIGPKDPATNEVIGGDKEVIFNLEYIFPLFKEQRVKGLLFFDAGNAYDVGDFDLGDLRMGAGFGIRWISPLGPLRLEWGFNLDKKEGEESSQFEFSIGGVF